MFGKKKEEKRVPSKAELEQLSLDEKRKLLEQLKELDDGYPEVIETNQELEGIQKGSAHAEPAPELSLKQLQEKFDGFQKAYGGLYAAELIARLSPAEVQGEQLRLLFAIWDRLRSQR